LVPEVDEGRCTACGVCAEVCAFHAITVIGSTVLVFPELCHSCGACELLCPEKAIHEEGRDTGVVEHGTVTLPGRPAFPLVTGVLTVGEAKAVPTTRATMAAADDSVEVVLIDAPPGTSCPVIEAVRGSDLVVLVTEPTPFGLHDLVLAVAMVRALDLRCVVALNRADLGDDRVQSFCAAEGIEIVLELPNDRRIAEAYSRGELLLDAVDGLEQRLSAAWDRISAAAQKHEVVS
jgi:MinD superfamily P-loop ATPase